MKEGAFRIRVSPALVPAETAAESPEEGSSQTAFHALPVAPLRNREHERPLIGLASLVSDRKYTMISESPCRV